VRGGAADVKLTVLGCGDAFGSGGRLQTCFHISAAAGSFLIDCGATALIAMRRFGVNSNAVRTVFLTHLHGDHFGGLPYFLVDARLQSKRTGPLTVAGPPGTARRLGEAMEALYPGSTTRAVKFVTEIVELEAGHRAEVNGVVVTPFEANHRCGSQPFALRTECDGRVVAYSGDGAWSEGLVAAGRHADLFIAEAYNFSPGIPDHLDYTTLKAHLDAIAPKRLILTHMAPDMLARRTDIAEQSAEDGMEIEL
jgi:ribonuclease BN (tRNA processing enzyme)